MVGYIYGLRVNRGPIRYVGQTVQRPWQRLRDHKKQANERKTDCHRWLFKHKYLDSSKIQLVILEECEDHLLNERERFWIEHYLNRGFNLLNMTPGGCGRARFKEFA